MSSVTESNFGDAKTFLGFTISDGEWRAIYQFEESISPAAQRNLRLAKSDTPFFRQTVYGFGSSLFPSIVTPASPLRVDEFALRPGPARANLRRLDRGKVMRLNLSVEVAKNRFEQFPLFLAPPPGSSLPAPIELGFVHYFKKELIST